MKYMFLLNRTTDALPEPGTAEFDQTMQGYGAALEVLGQAGVLIDCAPLAARSSSTTVRVRDGVPAVTDGPYLEAKEYLGSFDIIDCESLERALEIAARVPWARYGEVEVRPLMIEAGNEM